MFKVEKLHLDDDYEKKVFDEIYAENPSIIETVITETKRKGFRAGVFVGYGCAFVGAWLFILAKRL